MVLTHEFGHSLATKSVGGSSERIVLTPFGGVAYVNAPQRPGATLWSIAAGPLVNLVLVPLTLGLWIASTMVNAYPQAQDFIYWVMWINLGLLIFNMLPVTRWTVGRFFGRCFGLFVGAGLSLIIYACL